MGNRTGSWLIKAVLALALVGAFLPAQRVLAATCDWTGTVNTAWADAGNWNCAQVPGINDTAIIGSATNNPVVTAAATVGIVTVNSGGVLTYNGGTGIDFNITTFNINDGGKYVHNRAAVNPVAKSGASRNFAPNSTVEIQDFFAPSVPLPRFGILIVNNAPAVQFSGQLSIVDGDLTKQGAGDLRLATTQSVDVTIAGNLSLQGGTLTIQNTNNANTAAVTVGGNVTIGSGTVLQRGLGTGLWTLSVSKDWTNNGTFTAGTTGTVTFNGGGPPKTIGGSTATAFNNLTINGIGGGAGTNSVVVLPSTNIPTAGGAVTNNGVLQQTATMGASFHFANLKDTTSADKYRGVEIGAASLGETTVKVYGNQNTSGSDGTPVNRWYAIHAGSAGTADLTFHFLCSELQSGQTPDILKVWRYNGSTWEDLGNTSNSGATCDSGDYGSVTVSTVSLSAEEQNYVLKIYSPLAVSLDAFTAQADQDHVTVGWHTVNERDNLGFHLDRAPAPQGPWTRLNAALIPSVSPGSPWGYAYAWLDRDVSFGERYVYRLASVDLAGLAQVMDTAEVQFGVWQRLWLPSVGR